MADLILVLGGGQPEGSAARFAGIDILFGEPG
jgi:hypothetical protein